MKWCFVCFLFLSALSSSEEKKCLLYFTGQEDVSLRFVEKIQKETKAIRMAAHRLSQKEIIQALVEAHRRNVWIEVIVDAVSVTKHSLLKELLKEGIPVFVWNAKKSAPGGDKAKSLGHRFCVFGQESAWAGSYDFSIKSSSSPLEEALWIEDEEIAKSFLDRFAQLKQSHAVPLDIYVKQKGIP